VSAEHGGRFSAVARAANDSAGRPARAPRRLGVLLRRLDLRRPGRPFYKRAQLACADLAHAEVVRFRDLDRLTLFADNLVPHVWRVDGLLAYDEGLLARSSRGAPRARLRRGGEIRA